MTTRCAVALLVGVVVAGWSVDALAQGNQESQLVRISEFYVKPGMVAEWEEARKQAVAHWAENDFSYLAEISVNEEGVYRQVAVVVI